MKVGRELVESSYTTSPGSNRYPSELLADNARIVGARIYVRIKGPNRRPMPSLVGHRISTSKGVCWLLARPTLSDRTENFTTSGFMSIEPLLMNLSVLSVLSLVEGSKLRGGEMVENERHKGGCWFFEIHCQRLTVRALAGVPQQGHWYSTGHSFVLDPLVVKG